MAESFQYKVLIRHTADLQRAVKDNLTSLGAELVSAQIINLDQYEVIRNAHRAVNERGADLVGYVQNKVRQDPRHYHAFLGALQSDPSQYGDILTKLEKTIHDIIQQKYDVIDVPAETTMTDCDAKESEETTTTDCDAKESKETTTTDCDAKESEETTTTDCDAKESGDNIRFHCPCGKCSLETYLQDGCPKSHIPYLGMNTLSKEDQEKINYILKKDTKRIMASFADLSNKTCDSLIRRGITVDKLVRVAISSNPSLYDKLIGSESVDQVFSHLFPEMSFFNHETLVKIINELGDEDDELKSRLAKYSNEFKEFCKHKVFKVKPGYCISGQRLSQLKGRELFAVVLPKIEDVEAFQNLEDAVSIKEMLADELDIPLDTIHFHRIDPGSIILVFSVPNSVAEKLFPLPKEKLASLRAKGMLLFVPQDPKPESNLVKDNITACSADMHESSSKHTSPVSSLSVSSTTPSNGGPYNVEPGLCVIINNTNFKQGTELSGGDKDEQDLFKLFFSLRFEVKIHRNLTANEIVHKLESYSKLEHKGAFFLIILSHGTMGRGGQAIVGTDGKTVMMDDIERFFHATKCPTLCEVPKIFLIDACRSDQQKRAYSEPQSHDTSRLIPESADPNPRNRRAAILDTSDFLLVYASTHRHVLAYSTERGSRLTQTFIEVTNEAADDKTITEIIQEVRIRIEQHGQQTVESVDTLTHEYFIKRNIHKRGPEELHSEFRARVEKWIPVREETIQKIERIIDDLKKHHRNVNISRITGSSVSIAGSVIAIVGFGLAPVTLGASIGLSAGGIALAAAGGGTVAGASITDTVIQKLNVKQAQEQLKEDYDQLYIIQVIAKIIDSITVAASEERRECPVVGTRGVVGEVLAQGLLRVSNVGVRTAEMAVSNTLEIGAAALRIGGTAAKSIAGVGLVLNVVLVPVDLIEIVRSSRSLARGSQTKAVKQLKEIVEDLKQQLRELRSAMYTSKQEED